jgi:hypothetical protein
VPANYITLTIEPSGLVVLKRDQKKPEYDQIKAAVGGLIAPVDYACPPGVSAFVNDEGICLNMPANPVASQMTKYPQLLFGNCFVFFKDTSKRARKFFGV